MIKAFSKSNLYLRLAHRTFFLPTMPDNEDSVTLMTFRDVGCSCECSWTLDILIANLKKKKISYSHALLSKISAQKLQGAFHFRTACKNLMFYYAFMHKRKGTLSIPLIYSVCEIQGRD